MSQNLSLAAQYALMRPDPETPKYISFDMTKDLALFKEHYKGGMVVEECALEMIYGQIEEAKTEALHKGIGEIEPFVFNCHAHCLIYYKKKKGYIVYNEDLERIGKIKKGKFDWEYLGRKS